MSLVTICFFSVPEPVNDISKVQAGDFNVGNRPHRMSATLPGVSISDFLHEYRDTLNGWIFRNIKFKDASDVEWYFKKLAEHDPPIIMPINDFEWIKREQLQKGLPWAIEGETRYGIADKLLHDLVLRNLYYAMYGHIRESQVGRRYDGTDLSMVKVIQTVFLLKLIESVIS